MAARDERDQQARRRPQRRRRCRDGAGGGGRGAEEGSSCTRSWCRVVLPAAQVERLAVERSSTPSPSSQRPTTANAAVGSGGPPRAARSPRRSRGRRRSAPGASGTRSSSTTTRQPERAAMWPASRGEAVGEVEHRVARAREPAALLEPERRPDVGAASRKRARPAAAERAGDDEQSPGRAPPRPGTRSERPSAVTLRTSRSARGRVAADDRARPPRRSPRRARARRRARVSAGAPSVTISASGSAPDGGEVAEVDGGGPEAEVAPRDPVEPEVDALDERVLRDDERRRRAAPRRSRCRATRPRRSSSASRPSSPSVSERASTAARAPAPPSTARMTATPAAPARDAVARRSTRRCRRSRRPGRATASQIAREPVEPDRRVGVGLRRRRPDRPGADVGGALRSTPSRASSTLDAESPSSRPALARALVALRRRGRGARRRRRARAPPRRRR